MSVQELIKKRTIVKTKVTTFQTFLKRIDKDASKGQELPLRLERAEKLLTEYDEIQSQIEELTDIDTEERMKFEDAFYGTILLGKNTMARLIPSSSHELAPPVVTDTTTRINSLLKLPEIKLPTFNGEYDQWITFRDTFEAIVDSNTSLSKIQKFYYLQSAVKGNAAQCFQSLSLSNENYDAAWTLLKSRFENKRLIVHHHIQSILELPVLTKESCTNLRKLIDDIRQHIIALTKLEQPVQSWDTLLIHLLTPKLDSKTRREWEFKREFSTLPSMNEFIDFLNKRCSILETLLPNQSKDTSTANIKSHKKSVSLNAQQTVEKQCPLCKNSHWLYACPSFRKLSSYERQREAKRLKVCSNCLRSHPERECTFGNCQRCKRRHNTLLHPDNDTPQIKTVNVEQSEVSNKKNEDDSVVRASTTASTSHCTNKGAVQALLSTALVLVRDHNGYYKECRALLDSASQSHFMSKELCQRLQLNTFKTNHVINGIGQTSIFVKDKVNTVIKSKHNEYKAELSCFVVDSITGTLPPDRFDACQFTIPKNIVLADPKYNVPDKVDLLIGVTLFYELLQEKRVSLGNNQPVLQETRLGWIVGGAFMPCKSSTQCSSSQSYVSFNSQIQEQLERFWQLEEVAKSKSYTKEEQLCEDNFVSTHQRDENGRFIVRLPLKSSITSLGESQKIAERRLRSLEKKFHNDAELKEAYISFMQEYERLEHMSEIGEDEDKNKTTNYLPHHAVIKSTSNTTKVRVVFDASCKTTSGKSLNDILLVGPTIQNTLFNILLRFRQHTYVITSDIHKMYRQILIQPDQRDLQRILWKNPSGIQTFRLNTVTYGLASAPFLAIRCLYQLALECQTKLPETSETIKRDFYVDDLITGGNDRSKLTTLKEDITKILRSGCFELHGWNSNERSILSDEETDVTESVNFDAEVNTLGLTWNTNSDTFQYKVNSKVHPSKLTKRVILSTISQIFDPLGLIGPITIQAKLLLQDLWRFKIDWDDPVPIELHSKWSYIREQMQCVPEISIPRHAFRKEYDTMEVHGFCDASEIAYGCCIYIKSISNNEESTVSLLCAKSKVAPLKSISLPRLELCAALLLAELYQQVIQALTITPDSTYLWSDSTITLAWIKGEPSRWVQFVANRVTEIQRLTVQAKWNHVKSIDNPADIISRGTNPTHLKVCHLWWNGSDWLKTKDWPPLEETMLHQRMGDLPATRITTSRPFLTTGVDYGGPFSIKVSRNKTDKAYICIFVCFTTRAVHLELVVDLSTPAFIRAFQRFIARRDKCLNLYSDNAKKFGWRKQQATRNQ